MEEKGGEVDPGCRGLFSGVDGDSCEEWSFDGDNEDHKEGRADCGGAVSTWDEDNGGESGVARGESGVSRGEIGVARGESGVVQAESGVARGLTMTRAPPEPNGHDDTTRRTEYSFPRELIYGNEDDDDKSNNDEEDDDSTLKLLSDGVVFGYRPKTKMIILQSK